MTGVVVVAEQPIDCTGTDYRSTQCVGCPAYVVVAEGFTGQGMCLQCRRTAEKIDWPWFEPLGDWHPEVGYPAPGSAGAVSDGTSAGFGPAEYRMGPNLTPFAEVDRAREFSCLRCRERWPMVVGLSPELMVRAFADHDRVAHTDGVWLVGGPGGADEGVCAPCGGGDREKRPLDGGPDHTKCLKGKTSGWGGRCGCAHRSRDELDAIVGKNRRNWRPARWSDPKIVEIASENVKNRWNQLDLWENES